MNSKEILKTLALLIVALVVSIVVVEIIMRPFHREWQNEDTDRAMARMKSLLALEDAAKTLQWENRGKIGFV